MFTVAKRKLKNGMSAYLRRIERTGEEMVITDRRRPVLRVIPFREKRPVEEVFADLRGKTQATVAVLCAPTQDEWGEV